MLGYELIDYPVSIDLESAGIGPDAPIAAIGAVRFSKNADFPLIGPAHEFQVAIDLKGQAAIDPSTFYWWLRQSPEAQAGMLDGEGGLSLGNALRALWQWLQADSVPLGRKSNFAGELWVRGDRDSVWLESAHKREGMAMPYEFRKVRDQRTLVEFAEERGVDMPMRHSVAHDALEDARFQAQCLQAVYARWPEVGP